MATPPPTRWRRPARGAAVAAAFVALAACSGPPTGQEAGTVGVATPVASSSSPAGAAPSSTPPASGDTAQPVLGTPPRPAAEGFGEVRPSHIDLGGADSTGIVDDVTWTEWGGATATGTGTAAYVAPGAANAEATREKATVVASERGTCAGRPAYTKLTWYFPQHGQTAGSGPSFDVCGS